MKKTVLYELKRMLSCRSFISAILIGIAATTINVIENILTVQWFCDNALEHTGYETISLFIRWIGVDTVTIGFSVFYFIFPLLASMPYSWSFFLDKKSGYTNLILTRTKQQHYFVAKYLATFLSGAIAISIPLIVNLLMNAMICPVYTPFVVSSIAPVFQGNFLSKLYYTTPWLYCFGAVVMDFFWGGLCACLGLTLSLFLKKMVYVVLAPFIVFAGGHFLNELLSTPSNSMRLETSLLALLHPSALNMNPGWYVSGIIGIGLLATILIIYVRGIQHEVL